MPSAERYPKMKRNATERLRAVLSNVPGLSPRHGEDLALAINDMADKAHDLNDIFEQLLRKTLDAEELAELLAAFELTAEQLRGGSDEVNGRLYELSDRLRQIANVKRA
jgi:methyl-accepting chemotaxis protein